MQKPQQKRMLQAFVKEFTDKQVYFDLDIVSKNFYEVPSELKKLTSTVGQDFFCAGQSLGKIDKGRFVPSSILLNRLADVTAKKVVITEQAEWLFVCGRDVLIQSIKTEEVQEGPVIVMNDLNEVLGYGVFDGEIIKNRWDLGDFLRRER